MIHCLTGYIVIQDTDSPGVSNSRSTLGQAHGKVYMNTFGEDLDPAKRTIGEAFSWRSEETTCMHA